MPLSKIISFGFLTTQWHIAKYF